MSPRARQATPAILQDFALARYNTDGSLDGTFGSGGTVTTQVGDDEAFGFALVVLSAYEGETVGDGFDTTYPLPAANWNYIRQPGDNKGYRYLDALLADGPIRKVVLRNARRLAVLGTGSGLGHSLGSAPNPVSVVLTVGTKDFCTSFGGTTIFKADRFYKAKDAPPPTACPP